MRAQAHNPSAGESEAGPSQGPTYLAYLVSSRKLIDPVLKRVASY